MALIYRAIFEVDDPGGEFTDRTRAHVRDWLRFKLRDPQLELPPDGSGVVGDGVELQTRFGVNNECAAVRISAFEGSRDDGVEVKTTITAIRADETSWAWIDLERWMPQFGASAWVPVTPGVITTILLTERARRGVFDLGREPIRVKDAEGAAVAERVLDPSRDVPLVVVSYSREEQGAVTAAEERARELARRLAGVAVVYVLGDGAVTAFSRTMHEAVGEGMDVHSGAIRTYLPGAGGDADHPGRHRFVTFRKLEGRRPDLAALMIAPALHRRAVETPPPPIWRAQARALIAGDSVADYDELLAEADGEIRGLEEEIAQLQGDLALEKESVTDLARQVDDQGRRIRFLRRQLNSAAPGTPTELGPDPFDPVFCSEVVKHARETLELVEFDDSVIDGALALDGHADESWAKKAWLAFRALQEYAEAKADGTFEGDFKTCCERAATDVVVPASWVARTESKQTMENRRFAELRNLPVSREVSPSGRIVMETHIKIEAGGSPSPRIHFHDDTRGSTGMVHIGWFGDHLDSRAKS